MYVFLLDKYEKNVTFTVIVGKIRFGTFHQRIKLRKYAQN